MRNQNANVGVGLAILAYAAAIFWQSLGLDYYTKLGPGPGFFPLWVSGILIVFSLGYICTSLRKEKVLFDQILPKGKDLVNSLSIIAAILVFMLLINTTGFIIACTALLLTVLIRLYKWYLALSISLGVATLLFVTFQFLLDIPLPVSILGW